MHQAGPFTCSCHPSVDTCLVGWRPRVSEGLRLSTAQRTDWADRFVAVRADKINASSLWPSPGTHCKRMLLLQTDSACKVRLQGSQLEHGARPPAQRVMQCSTTG